MDNKASLKKRIKELKKRIEELKKDIELNPNDDMAYFDIGIYYSQLKEYIKAITAFQKAIEINPKNDITYYNIGNSYHELKDYDKAIIAYKKAIEINPKRYQAYGNMGIIHGALGEYNKAQEYYKKALMIQKENEYGIKVENETKRLKEVSIADYRMFKDFAIAFTDKEDKPLDIIVIAGENGTGKTTLFELIKEYSFIPDDVVYLPAYRENIEDLKANIIQKYINKASKLNDFKEALKELNEFISDVFEGLKFNFTISKIDNEEQSVRFTNNANDEFEIESLSTGEKTLLSKVLFLYFKDYKEKIILIDEPEISLHPSWQNHILKIYENFAKKYDSQVIIATHSPQVIGSASNESLRVLQKNNEGKIEVLKDLKAHGRDINSVLFDVMGEVDYRPKEFRDKIDRLYIAIDDKKFEEATKQLDELKKDYGENDAVVIEAQMMIDIFNSEE